MKRSALPACLTWAVAVVIIPRIVCGLITKHPRMALVVGAMFLSLLMLPSLAEPARKKLIATGWDQATTAELRTNLVAMEQQPFDGVVLYAHGHDATGKSIPMQGAFSTQSWQRAWFQSCVDDLKACKFQKFTDNFVLVYANPGDVDWFDDDGWRAVIEHWRIAAWLARQAARRRANHRGTRAASHSSRAQAARAAARRRTGRC